MSGGHEDDHRSDPGQEQVGGVAEEAAKLMGALAGWAREHGGDLGHGLGHGLGDLAGHAGAAARQVDDHIATGAPECSWCPVCRTIHTVRSLNPDVRQHLAVAASALAQAAAGLIASAVSDQRGGRRDPDLERIDLEEEWPEDEWPDDGWPDDAQPDGSANDGSEHDDSEPADGAPTNHEPVPGAPEHEGPGD